MPQIHQGKLVFFKAPTNNFYKSAPPALISGINPRTYPRPGNPAIAVINVDKTGNLAHQRRFMRFHNFVRIDDLPEHLHQMDTFLVGKTVLDGTGKFEKLDRILNPLLGRLD